MAQVNSDGEEHSNDIVLTSLSLTAETTTGTLTCPTPELPTLPFDVLPEILCRLPVKLLVQLRCICKLFNSLISDPNFAKKHLQLSTKRHHLMVTSMKNWGEFVHFDSPIPSVLSTFTVTRTQLYPPNTITIGHNFVDVLCSCDGIFCGMLKPGSYFLWNPSIRTFKLLPFLENSHVNAFTSFWYDCLIDKYKVIVVSPKNEVSVNTLRNDYWTRIEDILNNYYIQTTGTFVSGTVNWLAWDSLNSERVIVSLDLEKESYQKISQPDLVNYSSCCWTLGVLKDCLCGFAISDMFLDVWVMKEYGNKESWTKLYSVPYMEDLGSFSYKRALYISEDDQMLIELYDRQSDRQNNESKLVVYDSKNGTFNIPEIQSISHAIRPKNDIYIESLISP